jgi:hypothetical protein
LGEEKDASYLTHGRIAFLCISKGFLCAPRVSIQKSEFNAGDVPQGKEISNIFVLKNIGTDPLNIKVRPC